jgi:hypothetical protein
VSVLYQDSSLTRLRACVHDCVQVLLRRFILAHGYETSYTCLARRAAKTNNVWNRLVRRGSTGRRICVYGALQLAFTVISCSVFLPTYFSYGLAVALQVGWGWWEGDRLRLDRLDRLDLPGLFWGSGVGGGRGLQGGVPDVLC